MGNGTVGAGKGTIREASIKARIRKQKQKKADKTLADSTAKLNSEAQKLKQKRLAKAKAKKNKKVEKPKSKGMFSSLLALGAEREAKVKKKLQGN